MTIQIGAYFTKKLPVRKKEPQYLAFINRNSCTSCGSCATMCPVDCIYEIEGAPSESHHQIDTARCIGCQMCYRVPSESTGPWEMEICPWNAIDLIYNPNFAEKEAAERSLLWRPYFAGGGPEPNFKKLEELGYQLFLNRSVYLKKGSEYEKQIDLFAQEVWTYGEGNFPVVRLSQQIGDIDIFDTTEAGSTLVHMLYHDYSHMFLD